MATNPSYQLDNKVYSTQIFRKKKKNCGSIKPFIIHNLSCSITHLRSAFILVVCDATLLLLFIVFPAILYDQNKKPNTNNNNSNNEIEFETGWLWS